MRLGIDAREIENGVYTGIGRSLMQFLRYFDKALHNDYCILFTTKPLPFKFGDRIDNRVIVPMDTFWWDQVLLPSAIRQEGVELFFSPYYKIPLMAPCKKVSAILDVMYLKHEEYVRSMSWLRKQYYAVMGTKFVASALRIWTCSEYSRRDIVNFYGVAAKKIIVIPLAVSNVYRPLGGHEDVEPVISKLGIKGRYILYSGNLKPHKNVATLIKALALLLLAQPELSLVLLSPKRAEYEAIFQLAVSLGVAQKIVFTDTITDEHVLRVLYARAEVFVMPSLYEGFGIPVVEAMACGTPVVCSSATCLPDTCEGAALMVEPQLPSAYAEAIVRILSNAELRNELRAKGLSRVESIREERFGRRLHDLFRQVAGYV